MMMPRSFFFLVSFVLVLLTGACSEEKNPVQQYGNTMIRSLNSAEKAAQKAHLAELRKAVQDFQSAQGRYPADLDELKLHSGLSVPTDGFRYDPVTGVISEGQ